MQYQLIKSNALICVLCKVVVSFKNDDYYLHKVILPVFIKFAGVKVENRNEQLRK